MILLTGEVYPSPQILDAALDGPTVRVVDEEIHIGLLAHRQRLATPLFRRPLSSWQIIHYPSMTGI